MVGHRVMPTARRAMTCDDKAIQDSVIAAVRKGTSMIWKSEGGGPWGAGPRGGNGGSPWGSGRGGPGSGGPRGPTPPNLEEILRRGQDRFRRLLPGGLGSAAGIGLVVAVIVVLWLASGFYRVLPDEQGIVLRFGKYNRTTQPGLNYHLPT